MNGQRKTKLRLETVDLLVIRAIAVLFGTTFFLLLFFPKGWPWYLWLLDVRTWPPWKCIGFGVALVESLLAIRLWPSKKQRAKLVQRHKNAKGV